MQIIFSNKNRILKILLVVFFNPKQKLSLIVKYATSGTLDTLNGTLGLSNNIKLGQSLKAILNVAQIKHSKSVVSKVTLTILINLD